MKLDLEDELWSRLYGPYGNRSVNKQLAKLCKQWDNTLAKDLFWEELHHQNDIYPVTFAALPWIMEFSPMNGENADEIYLFLSHVIHCACIEGGTGSDGMGPRRKYRGLSTEVSDHHHSWIPENEWLTNEDRPLLINLETWFTNHCQSIAEDCLCLVGPDLLISAYALEGLATLLGSTRVAWSMQMFANGQNVSVIREEIGDFDERDTLVVAQLHAYISQRNPVLTSFLLNYPGCTFDPNNL